MTIKMKSLFLSSIIIGLVGCSTPSGQEILTEEQMNSLTDAGKKLGQFAGDIAKQVSADDELLQALTEIGKVSLEVSSTFLKDVMNDPDVQRYVEGVSDTVTKEIIRQTVEQQGGILNEETKQLIIERLKTESQK